MVNLTLLWYPSCALVYTTLEFSHAFLFLFLLYCSQTGKVNVSFVCNQHPLLLYHTLKDKMMRISPE